jgi:cytochrome c-type biogenesis protein CcsB
MKTIWRILPWCFLVLFGAEIVAVLMPKNDGEFHVREFARLPVLLNGRIQPFDSVARNSLLQIRSMGDVPLEEVPSWKFWKHPKKLKSTEWLLEVMTRPEQADQWPIFLIHHPDLIGELKLEDKGVEKSGLRYYTYHELRSVRDEVHEQASRIEASRKDEKEWTTVQKQTMKLENALTLYERLKNSLRPQNSDDFATELSDFQRAIGPVVAAVRASRAEGKEPDDQVLKRLIEPLREPLRNYDVMSRFAYPLIVPPLEPEVSRDNWVNAGASLMESAHSGEVHPAMSYFAEMATAYRHQRADEFNRAVADYKQWLAQKFEPESSKGRREFFYNDTKLFLHAMIIYVCAFILAGGALLTFALSARLSESLRRSGFYLVALAWIVHTFALVFRMVLEGRPPVTNLYSSAIFIGWGAVALGLVLERVYRVGIGIAVASFGGFVTLVIAHNLALGGDTMEMLRAVLDTNFWLATHVVVVTLGYASTFVAGLLAIGYIFLGLFTPHLARSMSERGAAAVGAAAGLAMAVTGGLAGVAAGPIIAAKVAKSAQTGDLGKALTKMVYAIVCFATLFSFVGTILGGIWADQSWGRFWGWDPKENGALMIVLWNALILHARWGGLVKERGLMNLAVFGNVVTSFSWFGVNMLGIGLHSYGFMDAAFRWLMLFVGSQLLIIGLGMLPLHLWASFRKRATELSGAAPKGKPVPAAV